ncbi:MAG: hypothetical protein KC503_41745 [Myxococcales bacterium]|nr:hypothetical protein [Myxococcales bacterium]
MRVLLLSLAVVVAGCPGGGDSSCIEPPGCSGQGSCCNAASLCQRVVCQGNAYVCESSGAAFTWNTSPTSAACQSTVDLGPPPPDGPSPDAPADASVDTVDSIAPDMGQGLTCSNGDVTFTLKAKLVACTKPVLVAQSPTPYPWIGGGIRDTVSKQVDWDTGPKIEAGGSDSKWTFSNVQVPCGTSGPWELVFMRDATNGDTSLGTIVATCTP